MPDTDAGDISQPIPPRMRNVMQDMYPLSRRKPATVASTDSSSKKKRGKTKTRADGEALASTVNSPSEPKQANRRNLRSHDRQEKSDDGSSSVHGDKELNQQPDPACNMKDENAKTKSYKVDDYSSGVIDESVEEPNTPSTSPSNDVTSPQFCQAPKLEPSQSVQTDQENNATSKIVMFIQAFFLLLIAFVILKYLPADQGGVDQDTVMSRLSLYQQKMEKIKQLFPSQNSRLWTITKVALEETLSNFGNNTQPAVVLIASSQAGHSTAECLANKLSAAFSGMCKEDVQVDGSKLRNMEPDTAKLKMDGIIMEGLRGGACSALIHRFESIPAFATTVFYQFCENDNAPFKNAAIFFTVQVIPGKWGEDYGNLSSIPPKLWDDVVGDYLTYSLGSRDPNRMTTEMISGLLSRITPSVVWVNREDGLRC